MTVTAAKTITIAYKLARDTGNALARDTGNAWDLGYENALGRWIRRCFRMWDIGTI